MRCLVGANPLLQNMIVQIEWLKDARRLTSVNGTAARPTGRLQIERANHLHMPMHGAGQQPTGESEWAHFGGLASSARLLAASTLTIQPLAETDAGLYSCQFKLIPAPSTAGTGPPQQVALGPANASAPFQFQFLQQPPPHQQQLPGVLATHRIISGQSSQAIQLTVIEGKFGGADQRLRQEQQRLVCGARGQCQQFI